MLSDRNDEEIDQEESPSSNSTSSSSNGSELTTHLSLGDDSVNFAEVDESIDERIPVFDDPTSFEIKTKLVRGAFVKMLHPTPLAQWPTEGFDVFGGTPWRWFMVFSAVINNQSRDGSHDGPDQTARPEDLFHRFAYKEGNPDLGYTLGGWGVLGYATGFTNFTGYMAGFWKECHNLNLITYSRLQDQLRKESIDVPQVHEMMSDFQKLLKKGKITGATDYKVASEDPVFIRFKKEFELGIQEFDKPNKRIELGNVTKFINFFRKLTISVGPIVIPIGPTMAWSSNYIYLLSMVFWGAAFPEIWRNLSEVFTPQRAIRIAIPLMLYVLYTGNYYVLKWFSDKLDEIKIKREKTEYTPDIVPRTMTQYYFIKKENMQWQKNFANAIGIDFADRFEEISDDKPNGSEKEKDQVKGEDRPNLDVEEKGKHQQTVWKEKWKKIKQQRKEIEAKVFSEKRTTGKSESEKPDVFDSKLGRYLKGNKIERGAQLVFSTIRQGVINWPVITGFFCLTVAAFILGVIGLLPLPAVVVTILETIAGFLMRNDVIGYAGIGVGAVAVAATWGRVSTEQRDHQQKVADALSEPYKNEGITKLEKFQRVESLLQVHVNRAKAKQRELRLSNRLERTAFEEMVLSYDLDKMIRTYDPYYFAEQAYRWTWQTWVKTIVNRTFYLVGGAETAGYLMRQGTLFSEKDNCIATNLLMSIPFLSELGGGTAFIVGSVALFGIGAFLKSVQCDIDIRMQQKAFFADTFDVKISYVIKKDCEMLFLLYGEKFLLNNSGKNGDIETGVLTDKPSLQQFTQPKQDSNFGEKQVGNIQDKALKPMSRHQAGKGIGFFNTEELPFDDRAAVKQRRCVIS